MWLCEFLSAHQQLQGPMLDAEPSQDNSYVATLNINKDWFLKIN